MTANHASTNRAEMDVTIRAEGLHKTYGRGSAATPVLRGIDLQVRRGQCVYLAGPSGSGKTTLLSIIGGILSADRGEVCVLGEDLATLAPKQRARLRLNRLGFVFQRFHLIRGLTVLGNVRVPLTLQGVPESQARRRAMELLEAVGIPEKASARPEQLSGGQCQRVAFARALVSNPDIILADEPTASLDAANGQEVMRLLRGLTAEQGRTVVVVTHDQRIFHFADIVYWLENGEVVSSGKPDAVPHPAPVATDRGISQ